MKKINSHRQLSLWLVHFPKRAASFEIVRSCLTIWYLRAFGVYKYWTAVRCQGSLQWQVCVTRYPRTIPSCHEYVGGNRDGVSRAICELTLPSALIPRCLLTSALIHCAGQDQSWEKLQLSQIRAPWVCVALGPSNSRRQQITVCVNHDLTLRSYQQTAQDCQSWLLVCASFWGWAKACPAFQTIFSHPPLAHPEILSFVRVHQLPGLDSPV